MTQLCLTSVYVTHSNHTLPFIIQPTLLSDLRLLRAAQTPLRHFSMPGLNAQLNSNPSRDSNVGVKQRPGCYGNMANINHTHTHTHSPPPLSAGFIYIYFPSKHFSIPRRLGTKADRRSRFHIAEPAAQAKVGWVTVNPRTQPQILHDVRRKWASLGRGAFNGERSTACRALEKHK